MSTSDGLSLGTSGSIPLSPDHKVIRVLTNKHHTIKLIIDVDRLIERQKMRQRNKPYFDRDRVMSYP